MRLRRTILALTLLIAHGCGGTDDSAPGPSGAGSAAPTPTAPTPTAPTAPAAPQPVARVCTGDQHTCVMRATGEVFCTGRNLNGEVGDGTAQTRWSWVPVQGVSGATQIACGFSHTCAITGTGVFCWGNNTSGELGAGHSNVTHVPVAVQGLNDATQLALGTSFSCARRASGAVSCWGDGSNGRLGNGATSSSATPVPVAELTGAVEVAAGRAHACARKMDGTVVCWGAAGSGQLGQGGERPRDSSAPIPAQGVVGAVQIAAGGNHTCAITGANVTCWGQNDYGQSGAGEASVTVPAVFEGLVGVTQLALGVYRTCALMGDGTVRCWGYNNYTGQLLGVGSQLEKETTPTPITGLSGVVRFDTAASGTNAGACALNAQNQLWCWGTAGNGRFGNGEPNALHTARMVLPDVNALSAPPSRVSSFPSVAEGLPTRTSFEVGSDTVCGVRDGRVYCFGPGSDGRLGHGSTRANPASAALPVAGIEDAVQVSTGLARTCALRRDGTVVCWGSLNARVASSLPIPIEGVTDARSVSVGGSAWAMTLCVVHEDGGVSCVGSPLGSGAPGELTATRIEGLSDIAEVNVGTDAACARAQSGQVYCWGSGSYGQLGNGATSRSATPVEVTGIRDAVALGGGQYTHCALRRNGSVSCWGSGEDGQLTNGQTGREASSATPVAIRALRDVASIGKMGSSMCVALRNGSAQCWGANSFGQTGHDDSNTRHVTTPWEYLRTRNEEVAALGSVVQMGCGGGFCCALHAQGGVSCAGSTPIGGSEGFLGIENRRSTTPIAASGITFPVVAP